MALPDGTRFRRHRLDLQLQPGDRTDMSAASGGFMKYSIPNQEYVRFEGRDDDAEADLRFYDFHPSQDWDPIGAAHVPQALRGGGGHPESGGRVEGRVRIGDRVIEVRNGMGHRDHSFGPRAHTMFRASRWHAGTVGPALGYSLVSSQGADGDFHKFGWLMRDGRREKIRDFHTVNQVLGDGLSTIGGWTKVILESGETLRIEAEVVDGIVTSTTAPNGGPGSSPAGVEAISIARWNGHEGVSDFNMIDNAHRGEQPVSHLFMANHEDGLSRRPADMSWVR
jgi:hypothetical protein